jgi:hypothetical protein
VLDLLDLLVEQVEGALMMMLSWLLLQVQRHQIPPCNVLLLPWAMLLWLSQRARCHKQDAICSLKLISRCLQLLHHLAGNSSWPAAQLIQANAASGFILKLLT